MKTLILDGSQADDTLAESLITGLQDALSRRGWFSETVVLHDCKIGSCAGDFYCWVRTPGICNAADDNRWIAEKIVSSDLIINLTPVTFGGYSSTFKQMLDHQIQNISPFFTTIHGEVHHRKRYSSYPRILTIGWLDEPDPEQEAIFRRLVQRNSLNMHAPSTVCGIVHRSHQDSLPILIEGWLSQISRVKAPAVDLPALPADDIVANSGQLIRHTLLLVGSPRTRKSTSYALGRYLLDQLNSKGVETQTIYLYTTLNNPGRMSKLYAALDATDLVVLAFPLYVDSLPAPVTTALERIASRRITTNNVPAGGPSSSQRDPCDRIRITAIANCGFPEARHNQTALAICAEFARQAGYEWLGGLALGGGEGIVHGTNLSELDGRATFIRQSLDIAAQALANGEPIPHAARALMAKPVIPVWLYSLFGGYGWRQQARRWGTHDRLKARPYQHANRNSDMHI